MNVRSGKLRFALLLVIALGLFVEYPVLDLEGTCDGSGCTDIFFPSPGVTALEPPVSPVRYPREDFDVPPSFTREIDPRPPNGLV